MTLVSQLTAYCRKNHTEWLPSGAIQRMELKDRNGKVVTPQTAGRALRSLEERKILAVKYMGPKHHAHYKYLPDYLRRFYIPSAGRVGERVFTISNEQVGVLIRKYNGL